MIVVESRGHEGREGSKYYQGDKTARYSKDPKRLRDAADVWLKRTVPGPLSKAGDV